MVKKSNEYTTKEIIEKLDKVHEIIQRIEVQTIKTNGRVTAIESQQKSNIESFTREKDAFADRLKCLESDNKMFTWKIAGVVAVTGILVSLVMMVIGKLI